jgi:hypothetical protein
VDTLVQLHADHRASDQVSKVGNAGSSRRAVLACRNEARRQCCSVRDVFDVEEHRKRFDVVMLLERQRERIYANCRYDVEDREARLGNVGRSAGRG